MSETLNTLARHSGMTPARHRKSGGCNGNRIFEIDHQPANNRNRDRMRKIGFKALAAILTVGSRSKRHMDWTLVVAIFSTIVTISLVALYIWHGRTELH